jgi:hypothetical protein
MHEAATEQAALSIFPFYCKDGGFNFLQPLSYGRSWLQSNEKEENQIWLEKRILLAVN